MKLSGILDLRPASRCVATGVAALGVLAFAAQADAADIYAPAVGGYRDIPVVAPVLSWSGFYAGAHVGGAWSNLNTTDLDSYWYNSYSYGALNTTGKPIATNPFLYGPLQTNQTPSGLFGGGTVGYNMQRGALVFGIEADFGAMDLNGSARLNGAPLYNTAGTALPYTETASSHISSGFYGDLTGRVGWAWGPWMLYGKGGLAVLEAKTNVTDAAYTVAGSPTTTYQPFGGSNNDSRVGWTAGAGFEYLWGPAWSVKVEYQYFDFGTASSSLLIYDLH